MPENTQFSKDFETDPDKNAPFRSTRRETQQARVRRNRGPVRTQSRGPQRDLKVRSERRKKPDVEKIAKALASLAIAQAQAEQESRDAR